MKTIYYSSLLTLTSLVIKRRRVTMELERNPLQQQFDAYAKYQYSRGAPTGLIIKKWRKAMEKDERVRETPVSATIACCDS